MSNAGWLHPLTRASSILTVRLMALERTMPTAESERAAWPHWDEYVRTCDALARCIQVTRGVTWGEASGDSAAVDAPADEPEQRAVASSGERYIYLLRAANGLWKIGRTHNLTERHATLSTLSPVAVWLHSHIRSDSELEGRLHARWRRFRTHGEWFQFPDRLIAKVQKSMMTGDVAWRAERDRLEQAGREAHRRALVRQSKAQAAGQPPRNPEDAPAPAEYAPAPSQAERAHLLRLRAFRLGKGPRP